MSAGFPPKICSLFVDKLFEEEAKFKCHILDVGCGKGYTGELLKSLGFFRLTGLDCSNALLTLAKEKKCYDSLEKMVFGADDFVVPDAYLDKFTFVISNSMINNEGFDEKVFKDLLKCCKMDGFVIFATKLSNNGDNMYE